MKYVGYTHFMQKDSSHYSEESDFDFEPPAPKKVKESIDLTVDEDTVSALINRLDLLEHGLNKTLESHEEKEALANNYVHGEGKGDFEREKISSGGHRKRER